MRDPDGAVGLQNYAGHHQLSDLHAAMANVRLQATADEMHARKALASVMDSWFSGAVAPVSDIHQGNGYRYIIRTTGEAESFIERLRQHDVTSSRPVTTPVSRLLGVDCPGAEKAWLDAVSLPVLADISETELEQLREALESCIS